MITVVNVNQLRGNPNCVTCLSNAALENGRDFELLADVRNVAGVALELK